mgnify:CR=1 FL=1
MNIRKPVDYTDLYAQLETALCRNKKQMDQYAAIGKAVALRPEKGAAVAAAGYIREAHPELSGFSPRNLRRMRTFYQTYGNHPDLRGTGLVSERCPAVWVDEDYSERKVGGIRPFE